ncbi:MAG: ribonuclease R [Nitrospiraceae bacterium]|nr:MAG: ribonuclease R [Nitrospiraceae bacterium]
MVDKKRVLDFFSRKTSRPVSFKEITQKMGLSRPESRTLKKILREMLRNGELVLTRKGLYAPAEDLNLVKGYFEAHRDGYGFIIPEKPGERDIFIPPGGSRGSMDGDRVVARIENMRRREGRVVRILERTHKTVVGKFEKSGTALFIKPKGRNMPFDLYVAPADRRKAKKGDTVIAEILSYPTDKRPATARVVNIIEKPDTPGADVEMIIDEFNLPIRFPRKVKEEAKRLYGQTGKTMRRLKRRDLRKLVTVTIDGENAKDFDDAISISLIEHGYRLWVHIADVGYYVQWNTLMDLEARKRGTSVYFPDRVIPMLPKELSEDLCSLRPKVERPAFTVEMDFNRFGKLLSANFYPSLIASNERMTYTSVRKILVDQDRDEREKYNYLLKEFDLMADLCGVLRSNRLERGSLDFDLPEPEVLLDLQGNPEAIVRAERNLAHMIIEEFMIAANEAVAEYMEQSGLPTLYRIHEEPDPMKLEDVFRVVRHFGRFRQKLLRPEDFSTMLKSIKGTAEEEIINYIVLRSLKQARYSTVNAGHFGLASKCYVHFTSPIRRYPDLIIHRILREKVEKKDLSDRRIKELEKLLPDIAFRSSQMERGADKAEREVIDTMKVWFMKDRLGEEFDAKIVGITPFGLKVRLKEFYVEGFLRVSSLTDDFYEYNDRTMRLNGRHTKRSFRIGQELTLRIDRIDMEEREVIFGL